MVAGRHVRITNGNNDRVRDVPDVLAAEYDNMLRCIRCAACLTSCPTYVVTHKEEEGPRGRIAIMRAHRRGPPGGHARRRRAPGQLPAVRGVHQRLPGGRPDGAHGHRLPRELLAAHAADRRRGRSRRGFAFGWLFGDLGHFRLLARLIWLYQRSGVQWLARTSGHAASARAAARWRRCCRRCRPLRRAATARRSVDGPSGSRSSPGAS